MPLNNLYPKVGVGVMILKNGQVLLGQRKSSHGTGEYSFPGGHLEYMESLEECAIRETKEECGIEIANIRFQMLSNLKIYAPKHYVHIGMVADWLSGEPQVLEPENMADWQWYDLTNLPQPIFLASKIIIDSFQSNKHYLLLEEPAYKTEKI
ncbi:MAG: NUDIX domain-containing protein [Candidatus Pacebacteria bacterium]|nr:NUDIX domain-containing protein [Candidatus Paceibacterota bacterium]